MVLLHCQIAVKKTIQSIALLAVHLFKGEKNRQGITVPGIENGSEIVRISLT